MLFNQTKTLSLEFNAEVIYVEKQDEVNLIYFKGFNYENGENVVILVTDYDYQNAFCEFLHWKQMYSKSWGPEFGVGFFWAECSPIQEDDEEGNKSQAQFPLLDNDCKWTTAPLYISQNITVEIERG